MKRMFLFAVFLSALAVAPASSLWAEDAPATAITVADSSAATGVVKNFYGTLTETMKQGEQLGFGGRVKQLAPVITSSFNLPLMTKIAVGPAWAGATLEQQQQLVSAFSDYSVATYASRFATYDGEQFDVIDEKPVSGGLMVETKLQPKSGDPVAMNYMMRKDDKGQWRIVDVFLNGSISELAAQRSEFGGIARRDGIPALVNSLGEKSKTMGPG